MANNYSNLIILTGAGFTANFGGFLARDMWAKIFNHPNLQAHSVLRENFLRGDFDFEKIYSEVLDSEHIEESVKIDFIKSVESAYADLDNSIKDWIPEGENGLNISGEGGFNKILDLCMGDRNTKSLIFTLNQDLFFERHWQLKQKEQPIFRSFGAKPFDDNYCRRVVTIDKGQFITLPTKEDMEKLKNDFSNHSGFAYIKLHGSYGWLAQDKTMLGAMAVGINKPEAIDREPLLKWYSELFKEVVEGGNKKILIIGYGFRDKHINNVLFKGVQNGLKLYIINPSSPDKCKQAMDEGIDPGNGGYLWDGVCGYFPYSLKQIFPAGQVTATTMFNEIKRSLTA